MKALYFINFSMATFFIICELLNSQQGLANPPPENKWAFRTYVQCSNMNQFETFCCSLSASLNTSIYNKGRN